LCGDAQAHEALARKSHSARASTANDETAARQRRDSDEAKIAARVGMSRRDKLSGEAYGYSEVVHDTQDEQGERAAAGA
jgi:hypothetical protein